MNDLGTDMRGLWQVFLHPLTKSRGERHTTVSLAKTKWAQEHWYSHLMSTAVYFELQVVPIG